MESDSQSQNLGEVCDRCLDWAAERDYAGYDPYDGLNSPIIDAFATNWLTRLMGMHGVNKAPINLRPILRVPRERNPKGIALFVLAYLNRYRETNRESDLQEAEALLRWLNDNRSPGYGQAAWGYNFDWQNGREFFLPAHQPSIVVTVFGGRAFLEYHKVTKEPWALEVARSASKFIKEEIQTKTVEGHDVFTYTPSDSFILVNTNALAAGFFYQLSDYVGCDNLHRRSFELFDFVIDMQTDNGGWFYAVPPDKSHLKHDNFHTGFVLESLYQYAEDSPSDQRVSTAYEKGLNFYQNNLFDEMGQPRFESGKKYPYDAHAAAQAILTLSQPENERSRELAMKVCNWSIDRLLDEEGYFYRRIGRFISDKTPYMRWSQAWMCRALSKSVTY